MAAPQPSDLYAEFAKNNELWWALVPEIIQIQHEWIKSQLPQVSAQIPEELRPFLDSSVYLISKSNFAARYGEGFFAALTFRSIVERVCLLWSASNQVKLTASNLLNDLEGTDQKARRAATESMVSEAQRFDDDMHTLYMDILSRYFSHVSHFDLVQKQHTANTLTGNPKEERIRVLPVVLLFDVAERLCIWMDHMITEAGATAPARLGGKAESQYDLNLYIRLAMQAFCERHSPSQAIELGMLITGNADIEGQVGLTKIYRGGMELFRYGDPTKVPETSKLKEFAMFAVGNAVDWSRVKIYLRKRAPKGERYEIAWPKDWEVCYSLLAMTAATTMRHKGITLPMFDYITEFHRALKMQTP